MPDVPEIEARLERAVAAMERFVAELHSPADPAPAMTLEMIALIASHRGESILATMERLAPPGDPRGGTESPDA